MLKDRIVESYTFDDVLLLPGHSKVLPSEVSVKSRITQSLGCNIPLISAAMDTVTEHQKAICMAQEGGIGIVHKNMTAEDQATQVKMVKMVRMTIHLLRKSTTAVNLNQSYLSCFLRCR